MTVLEPDTAQPNGLENLGTTLAGTIATGFSFDANNERGVVNNAHIKNLTADKITSGTINSSIIYGGTITGNQISGGTLTLGGTSNGDGVMEIYDSSGTKIIRGDNTGHHYYNSSGTLQQVGVDADGFHAYNSSGTEQLRIDETGLFAYGTVPTVFQFRSDPSSGTYYGALGFYAGTPGFYISGSSIRSISQGTTFMIGTALSLISTNTSGTGVSIAAVNGGAMRILSDGTIHIFTTSGSNKDITITADDDLNLNTGGSVIINGVAKSAIVPTQSGYKALYCTESPEVWFMDFCESKDKIDPLFKEVTVPPYKFIKCDDDTYQVWGKRKGMENIRFEDKSVEEFDRNNNFWGQALRPALTSEA